MKKFLSFIIFLFSSFPKKNIKWEELEGET